MEHVGSMANAEAVQREQIVTKTVNAVLQLLVDAGELSAARKVRAHFTDKTEQESAQ